MHTCSHAHMHTRTRPYKHTYTRYTHNRTLVHMHTCSHAYMQKCKFAHVHTNINRHYDIRAPAFSVHAHRHKHTYRIRAYPHTRIVGHKFHWYMATKLDSYTTTFFNNSEKMLTYVHAYTHKRTKIETNKETDIKYIYMCARLNSCFHTPFAVRAHTHIQNLTARGGNER